MNEILQAIQKGDFDTAAELAAPLKKRIMAKNAITKITTITSYFTFAFFAFCAFCGMCLLFTDPAVVEVYRSIPIVSSITTLFHSLFTFILGGKTIWYLQLLLWILVAYLMTALISIVICFITPMVYHPKQTAKIKEILIWREPEKKAEQFKKWLIVDSYDPNTEVLSNTASAIFCVLTIGSGGWMRIIIASPIDNIGVLLALATIGGVVFFKVFPYPLSLAVHMNTFILEKSNNHYNMHESVPDADMAKVIHATTKYVDDYKAEKERKAQEQARLAKEQLRKTEEEKQRQLEIRYNELIANDPIDEAEMEALAKQGSVAANFYIGERLFEEHLEGLMSGTLTQKERENLSEKAVEYLTVAKNAKNIVAEFLIIALEIHYKAFNHDGWSQMLRNVRKAQKSGKLKESYIILSEEIIPTIVVMVDKTAAGTKEPKIKRTSCKYCNSEICTYYSTASYISNCKYPNDPGSCAAALNQHALVFEFE